MIIAIDFDKTWTADPELWRMFVTSARKRGHNCIIATGRKACSEDMKKYNLHYNIEVIYCGGEYKEKVCRREGWKVDVWIDDMPSMIQESLIIGKDEEL